MQRRPYAQFRPVTPGTNVAPGDGVFIAATGAGWVRLVAETGQNLDIYVPAAGTTEVGGVRIQNAGTSTQGAAPSSYLVTVAAY